MDVFYVIIPNFIDLMSDEIGWVKIYLFSGEVQYLAKWLSLIVGHSNIWN